MRMRVSVSAWGAAFLALLGLAHAPGCGGGGGIEQRCLNRKVVKIKGVDTGFDRCNDDAFMRRRDAVACPVVDEFIAHQSGYDSCTTDADCASHELCFCGNTFAGCVPAKCRSDTDCGEKLCASNSNTYADSGNGDLESSPVAVCPFGFVCQTDADECASDSDCSGVEGCELTQGKRVCKDCSVGRPFLIDGEARTARPAAHDDWSASLPIPCIGDLDPALQAELADRWTHMGLMEHASVAAFARFVLQLLSLGAPPELVLEAQAAMADEIAHARVCFSMASAYAGRPIGPGPLAIDHALDAQDPRTILTTAIREVCIGETIAALEAAEGAARATDPVVASALAKIADDERRHALLAWRFVRWAIANGGDDLRAVALEAVGAAVAGNAALPSRAPPRLATYGIVEGGLRHVIREQAWSKLISPCVGLIVGRNRGRSARQRRIHASV